MKEGHFSTVLDSPFVGSEFMGPPGHKGVNMWMMELSSESRVSFSDKLQEPYYRKGGSMKWN